MYCNEKEVANCLPVQKSSHHPCHPMLKGACLLRLKRTHASKARCVSSIYQPVILRSNPPSQVRLGKGGVEAHRIVNTCQPRMRACCGAMGQSPCFFFFLCLGIILGELSQRALSTLPKLILAVPMPLHVKLSSDGHGAKTLIL